MTEDNNVEMQTESTENNTTFGPHVGQVQWFNKKKGCSIERNRVWINSNSITPNKKLF